MNPLIGLRATVEGSAGKVKGTICNVPSGHVVLDESAILLVGLLGDDGRLSEWDWTHPKYVFTLDEPDKLRARLACINTEWEVRAYLASIGIGPKLSESTST